MIRASGLSPAVIEITETTPEDRARARADHEQYLRNVRWFSDHAAEIGRDCVGRYVCVAGQELFVAETAEDVLAQALAKHPGDRGALFWKYVSPHRGPKVYAHSRSLAGG